MNIDQQDQFNLQTNVQFLRGVGPRRAQLFSQLGIKTVGDLLEYFPRDYEFRPPLTLIKEINVDQNVTVAGEIDSMRFNKRSRPPRLNVILCDPTGKCHLVWFHGGYLCDKLFPGDRIAAWGKVARYKDTMQIVNPRWIKVNDFDELIAQEGSATPIYPATAELSSLEIARVISQSLDKVLPLVKERYTQPFRTERKLPNRLEAVRWIHRPADQDQINQARRALAYDELFLMELGIGLRREHLRSTCQAYPLQINQQLDKRIRRLFPFDFTADQNKVTSEICQDLAQPKPMNRLLQGDVGSGKTAVALYAALTAIGHHKQVAIMAPTEILAEQHFLSIQNYLRDSRVRRVLLKGGLIGKKRDELIKSIAQGEIDIVVGTQALLQQDVGFSKLALVIIDEQHKFGVRQRQTIRSKNIAPHYLVMTATPIPRTLAMTVFGDLEISTIEHLPPGRKPVNTSWIHPNKITQAYQSIRAQVKKGRQVYFVYPRVEEAEFADQDQDYCANPAAQLKAAVAEHKKLRTKIFPEFNVGLLHGQMDQQQKQQIMQDFRSGKIDILVATVVIEVGVDVPNATIMVIEHAEWFGLAQLHQLRGRIGRGSQQSYCLLFGTAKSDQAKQRLEIMAQTSDGFRIAEEDLRIRGPGRFFGTSQHGLGDLKIANLTEDFDLLRMAQRDAFAAAKQDPQLKEPQNQQLRHELKQKFGNDLPLVDVG